jgi:phosphatidylserine/phosphatidylglycerophosphate/cardiolipin synthase-like enzyme
MLDHSLPRSPSAVLRDCAWRWFAVLLLCSCTVGCAGVPQNVQRTASQALQTPEDTSLGKLVAARRGQARSDSGFMLLSNVDLAFGSRLALIDNAQRTLDLQYYAIHADSTTEILLEHLRAAARRGVRVRILLDDFNSVGEDAQVLRLAFVPGVEMRLFNPLPGSRSSLFGKLFGSLGEGANIQKRMHNKLFLADNAWGVAGGRNLGDAYFGGDGESAFVDLDVLTAGAIVRQMSASFDRYWSDNLAYPVQALLSKADLDRLRDEARKEQDAAIDASRASSQDERAPQAARMQSTRTVLPNTKANEVAAAQRPALDLRQAPLTWAPATLLADQPGKVGPGDDEVNAGDTVVDGLVHLMEQARQEVLVISPYFVPGPEMMKVFAGMRARGVAIRVLTNSLASNDAPAAHAGYSRYRRDLLAMGVELHEMRSDPSTALPAPSGSAKVGGSAGGSFARLGSGVGGSKSGTSRASLHAKAVVIDRRLAVIGSMNLDLRSQRQNSEVAMLIRSAAVSEAAIRLIETTFARDAYQLEVVDGGLQWRAPKGAPFKDTTSEPGAGLGLRLLVDVLGPFAPEQML